MSVASYIIKNALDNNQYETISAKKEPCTCNGEGCKYCQGTGTFVYYVAVTKITGIIFYYASIDGELRFWLSSWWQPNRKSEQEQMATQKPTGPFGDLRRLKR